MQQNTIQQNTQQQNAAQQAQTDMITLHDIIDMVLRGWKWFLLSTLVCLVLGYLYAAKQNNVYQRQAVMLVKEEGNRRISGNGAELMANLNGMSLGNGVDNEKYILQSHMLVRQVVEDQKLDVSYSISGKLRTQPLYKNRPFTMEFFDEFSFPVGLRVTLDSETQATIHKVVYGPEKLQYKEQIAIGDTVTTDFGTFCIRPIETNMQEFVGKTVNVSRSSIEATTNRIQKQVTTSLVDKQATLVTITCVDNVAQRAEDILQGLLDMYKLSIIKDKNTIAESTAAFIDSRLKLISAELSDVEGELAEFKQANQLVDLSANAQSFLQESSQARQQTIQLESQVSVVQYLLDYVKNTANGRSLIPSL